MADDAARIEEWAERLQCADLGIDYPLTIEIDGEEFSGWMEQPHERQEHWRSLAAFAFEAGLTPPQPVVVSAEEVLRERIEYVLSIDADLNHQTNASPDYWQGARDAHEWWAAKMRGALTVEPTP